MKHKRLWITLTAIICACTVTAAVCFARRAIMAAGTDATLQWTIIGAMGSWAGSVFGAFALVISILAFRLPQKVRISADIGCGFMISQIPGMDKIDAYIITVKNTGIRPVTITNVYLHFGDKKQGDIFVGMLNQGSVLQAFTPTFPKRLEQGESFQYHLLKDKLDAALVHYEGERPLNTSFSIRVDEVTEGTRYYKTKWTLENFIQGKQ